MTIVPNQSDHDPAPIPHVPSRTRTFPDIPRLDIALSLATNSPIPREWLPQVTALVREQQRIGAERDTDELSQMEALVTSKGILAAEEARERGADELAALVEQAASVRAEMSTIRGELSRIDQLPVTDMDGSVVSAAAAADRMKTVSTKITAERDTGSVKHRRVPAWVHRYATKAAYLDFPVLLYFLMQVFNVDVAGLLAGSTVTLAESVVPLITSIMFALLGTGAVAIGLKFLGRDLKAYKDADGHPKLPEGKARTIPLLYLGLAAAIAIGAGIVMAYRIATDAIASGSGLSSGIVLGVFFAIIVVTVNIVVVSAHYRDGSLQTDEIDHLTVQLAPVEQRRVDHERRLDNLAATLPPMALQAERIYARTLALMGTPLKGADQLRLLARSYHQGCGAEALIRPQSGSPQANLVAPAISVDRSVLDELLKQLGEIITDAANATTPTRRVTGDTKRTPTPAATDDAEDDLGGDW
ncbi:hypothetical protein FEK35_15115 [Nocardia cyriacigeorgica]|uniref:Uncharacterized protein n=1 Tax=Nocardia cyriacigeorgica TaxID=135487 RepID=A0A5R8PDK8_9NOCA|nr:hypothetical protein [Nocardia cyriacigeorgica]TLG09454.1 hypothetical protein FEK35_15115 [Nocardia cyriacigeorgica]